MGSREALALHRLDELEGSSDSQGAPAARVVPVDGKCVFVGVLGRDPRGESVGELDLGKEEKEAGMGEGFT